MEKIKKLIYSNRISICLLLFIISFCFFLLLFFSKDPDYYWHIKAGEYMFKDHTILTHDVFSWYLNGKYWMSHEWLFEVILYGLSIVFPRYHIVVYTISMLVGLSITLFFSNKDGYKKNIPFTLCWITFLISFYGMIQARPYMISFILFALCLYFLFDLKKNENSRKIYFLPLISVIWSNVHGGSSNLPYLFIIIFLVTGLFSFSCSKIESSKNTKKQNIKYLIAFVLCVLAIIINPHGIKMLVYPYQNMADKLMQANISEWHPTNLSNLSHYPYLILIALIFFTFLFSKRKINFLDLIIFIFVFFLGMKSIRFWPYTYISMSFIVFDYVSVRKYDNGTCGVILMVTLLCILLFVINIKNIKNKCNIKMLNDEIIEIIKKEKPKRLYNFYDYGGYLVYKNVPVFVDGRADLYSSYNYSDYLGISNLSGEYEDLIKYYDFDYYLVPDKFPIYNYLKYSDNYKLIMYSNNVVFYQKIS